MASKYRFCEISGEPFSIFDRDRDFYAQMEVSEPRLSPLERMRRRLSWRNERNLYHRVCDRSNKRVISIYSPEIKIPVYDRDIWWSDSWDALEYGRAYDFSRSFCEQFGALFSQVPRLAISNRGENSGYCNYSADFKNSYMCVSGMDSENLLYSYWTSYSYQCVDCTNVLHSQFCYECIDSNELYECLYCQDCESSNNLRFCLNCHGSNDCFGCVGLYKKQYHIFNEPYSKSGYEAFLETQKPLSRQRAAELVQKRDKLARDLVFEYYHGHSNENVTGDYVAHCRDVFHSFDVYNSESVSYSHSNPSSVKSAYDSCYTGDAELLLDCLSAVGAYNQVCCMFSWNSSNISYCDHCFYCQDLIGCVGLRSKRYCILNKQYSEAEYRILAPQVIERLKQEGVWGEFLPTSLSPFAYNETAAMDYLPLTRQEALGRGYRWKEDESRQSSAPAEAPETISQVDETLLSKTLRSPESGAPFKIIRPELEFYKKMDIPPPALTSGERMQKRLGRRNPRKLWRRRCQVKSDREFYTTYSPERSQTVACEQCYQEAFFS